MRIETTRAYEAVKRLREDEAAAAGVRQITSTMAETAKLPANVYVVPVLPLANPEPITAHRRKRVHQ